MSSSDRQKNSLDVGVYALGMALQQILTFGSGVVIARYLGPTAYGITSLTRGVFAVALIMAPLGLDLALLRHTNEHPGNVPALIADIRLMRRIVFAVSALVLLIVAVAAGPALEAQVYHIPHFAFYLTLAFAAFPFAADTSVCAAALRGFRRPIFQSLASLYIQPIVRMIALVTGLLLGLGVTSAILATAVGAATSSIVLSFALRFVVKSEKTKVTSLLHAWPRVRSVFAYSLWLAITLLAYGMLRSMDILILGWFRPAREVGVYASLSAVCQLVLVLPQAFSQTLGPAIAQHYHAGDPAGMKLRLSEYLRNAVLTTSPIFAGIAVFGPWLHFIFGPSFVISQVLSSTLASVFFVSALFAPMGYSLSMTGLHKLELSVLIVGIIVALCACIILAPNFGAMGVACGIGSGYLFIDLTRTVIVARRLGFVPGSARDFIPPLSAIAIALFCFHSASALFTLELWSCMLVGLIYLALTASTFWVIALSDEERLKFAVDIRKGLGRLSKGKS